METVTVVYKFLQCPETDLKQELAELGYDETILPDLNKVNKSQEAFSNRYNIPYINLVPHTTSYNSIANFSSEHKVWHVRDRYLYFDFGVVFWEVTFNTNLPNDVGHHLNDYINIDGYNLLSNAIYRKTILCKGEKAVDKRCVECELSKTYDDIRLIFTEKDDLIKSFRHENHNGTKYENYTIRDITWIIRKLWQIVDIGSKEHSISQLRNAIVVSSIIPISIKYSGNEIITRLMGSLPPISSLDTDMDEKISIYVGHFLHRYFFTSPDFILQKNGLRLHIPPLLLKCLNYAYDNFGDSKYWDPNEDILSYIPRSLLVINRLFIILHYIPHPVSQELQAVLNPFNAALPVGSQNLHNKLDHEHIKIVMIMARKLVQSTKTNRTTSISNQAELEPYSTSGLTEELGYPRGRKNKLVQKKIDKLVRNGILVKTSPDEINITRGRAKELYYLNPQLAYTQFIVQLVQHMDDKEIETLVSYLT